MPAADLDTPPHPPPSGSVLVSISERLIRVLPPAFLLMVILNCAFLAVITYVFDHNSETRNVMLAKIIEKCLLKNDHSEAPAGIPSVLLAKGAAP